MQSAVLATAIPSVCLSHAGTLSRRMKIGSRGLHCEVAKTFNGWGRRPLHLTLTITLTHAYNVSNVRASEKSSTIANRNSTTRFPTTYRWSLYVNSTPQRVARKANLSFKDEFHYISVTDEARDFKFGVQLGFAKAHHQIPPEENMGVALG